MTARRTPRTADPYRDLAVIDARAPRFNQAAVGILSLVAVVTGWWLLLGLVALQLTLGLWLGRRFCLPCVAYFELVQPRLGEGPLEDSRPLASPTRSGPRSRGRERLPALSAGPSPPPRWAARSRRWHCSRR